MTSITGSKSAPRRWPGQDLFEILKTDPFLLCMFFCLMLLGGDRMAIGAGGLTLRVVFPLLMAAFFFLNKLRDGAIAFDRSMSLLFFLLAIAGGISTLNSLAPGKSVGYTIWVLFDFFIIISLCYNLTRLYPAESILKLWLWVFRIHGILILLILPLNLRNGDRPTLWFYETSYLAIFMTAYFGSSLFLLLREGRRRYGWDMVLAIVVMLVLTSATAILGAALSILLNLLVARQRLKLFLLAALGTGLFMGVLYLFFRETRYYALVAAFLLEPNASFSIILARGGNRLIRLLVGWDAFLHHPWTGVGIGGDAAYMTVKPYPENAWVLVSPLSGLDEGQPFCNIVVEVLGTMGIMGFIPFASILFYSAFQAVRLFLSRASAAVAGGAFFMGFFSTFLALQLEGTFLRYYLWAPLGLGLGVVARMRENAGKEGT